MNTAQAWWEEIQQAPYAKTYIDYDFMMTCGYEWIGSIGLASLSAHRRAGRAGPVFNLMREKYGDFIQTLSQEQWEDYQYRQSNSIAGSYLYEVDFRLESICTRLSMFGFLTI